MDKVTYYAFTIVFSRTSHVYIDLVQILPRPATFQETLALTAADFDSLQRWQHLRCDFQCKHW
jgi:hypothetical protein